MNEFEMEPEMRELLLRFDEVGQYETPKNFNYRKLKSDVLRLSENLKNKFALQFTVDDRVEDASFFCDILIPRELVTSYEQELCYSIRISNFGRLATLLFEEDYSQQTTSAIIEELKKSGFTYLNRDVLASEYDGKFEDFKNILGTNNKPDWAIRYFDYL